MRNDYFKLLRVNNLLFIAIIIGLMINYVAEPILCKHLTDLEFFPWWVQLLLVLGTVCIAAGGNVINDYFDVKIDAINKPDELIVTRSVSKQTAMRIFIVLTAIGIGCGVALGVLLKSTALISTFVVVPGVLWFYSASYKRQFIVGNLIIAFLAGLAPLVAAMATDGVLMRLSEGELAGPLYVDAIQRCHAEVFAYIGAFAIFSLLGTFAREVIKDIEDQDGDRELECHTIVVKYGETAAKVVATLICLGIIALMTYIAFGLLHVGFSWRSLASRFYWVLLISFACELVLLWKSKLKTDYRHAQLLMKFILFLGTMFAFCVPSLM